MDLDGVPAREREHRLLRCEHGCLGLGCSHHRQRLSAGIRHPDPLECFPQDRCSGNCPGGIPECQTEEIGSSNDNLPQRRPCGGRSGISKRSGDRSHFYSQKREKSNAGKCAADPTSKKVFKTCRGPSSSSSSSAATPAADAKFLTASLLFPENPAEKPSGGSDSPESTPRRRFASAGHAEISFRYGCPCDSSHSQGDDDEPAVSPQMALRSRGFTEMDQKSIRKSLQASASQKQLMLLSPNCHGRRNRANERTSRFLSLPFFGLPRITDFLIPGNSQPARRTADECSSPLLTASNFGGSSNPSAAAMASKYLAHSRCSPRNLPPVGASANAALPLLHLVEETEPPKGCFGCRSPAKSLKNSWGGTPDSSPGGERIIGAQNVSLETPTMRGGSSSLFARSNNGPLLKRQSCSSPMNHHRGRHLRSAARNKYGQRQMGQQRQVELLFKDEKKKDFVLTARSSKWEDAEDLQISLLLGDEKSGEEAERPRMMSPEKLVGVYTLGLLFCSVFNAVFFRLMSARMANHSWFISQMSSAIYVPVFGVAVLAARSTGIIEPPPGGFATKMKFCVMGGLDGISSLMMIVGGAFTSGTAQVMLGQATIPVALALTYLLLNRRFHSLQYWGAVIILFGVAAGKVKLPFFSSPSENFSDPDDDIVVFNVIFLLACFPAAMSQVYKEMAFRQTQLDVNYVQLWVAIFQVIIGFGLAPFQSLWFLGPQRMPIDQMFSELRRGALCLFAGINSISEDCGNGPLTKVCDDCQGAWTVVAVYMVFNIMYNVFTLLVVKHGGAALTYIVSTLRLPLSTMAFYSHFLMGSKAQKPQIADFLGLAILLSGLVLYRLGSSLIK